MTAFPSAEHREELCERLKAAGYKLDVAFPYGPERRLFVAYDVAWRRVYLDTTDETSPLDPKREFYDRLLVLDAERIWRVPPRRERVAPAESARDPAQRRLYEAQDRERARLAAAVTTERLPSGELSPEAAAYVECCMRQTRGNLAMIQRMPTVPGDNDMDAIHDALGIRATPEAAE